MSPSSKVPDYLPAGKPSNMASQLKDRGNILCGQEGLVIIQKFHEIKHQE